MPSLGTYKQFKKILVGCVNLIKRMENIVDQCVD